MKWLMKIYINNGNKVMKWMKQCNMKWRRKWNKYMRECINEERNMKYQ